jgi:hypothetical protein
MENNSNPPDATKRDVADSKRKSVQDSISRVSERKTRTVGNTTFNIGIAYNENGETINTILLQLMQDKHQHGNLKNLIEKG